MKTLRTIKKVFPSQKVNMGGHLLDQPLPNSTINDIDPFLLIHHWKNVLPPGGHPRDVGVGPHPHRGFSPVTFVFKGDVQHRDSLGNNAIVYAGGTQWMSAGKGITHSERPSAELAKNGGENEFIQFWVNTPAAHKSKAPYYLALQNEDTPKYEEELFAIGIVAGEFMGLKGPADTQSPQLLLRCSAQKGAQINIPVPTNFNAILYLLDGEMTVGEQIIKAKNLAWFMNDGQEIALDVLKESRFIVLSGEPINEKIASYGPFVMNNQTEIMEAMRDSQMGKMGVLIEEF